MSAFDLAGPQGPQGPTGPAGPTGATGPTGPGVPTGGVVGTVLGKTGSADYATGWVAPPPGELLYAEVVANVSLAAISAATAVAVTPVQNLTLDGATVILIEFVAPVLQAGSGAAWGLVNLWVDGADTGAIAQHFAGNSSAAPCYGARRLTPSAGAHTFQIKGWSTGSPYAQIVAGSGAPGASNTPAFIRISRVRVG